MLRFFYALFLILVVAQVAQAQADFRPGYIVQPAGDTVRGEVAYSGAQRSARKCRFRPTPTAAATSYNADQLRGYGFPDNKAYEARVFARPDSGGYVLPPRPVFMEVLVAGPVTLYYYYTSKGQEQYYIASAPTGPVQELVHTSEVAGASVNNYYRENNRFRGTLAEAFAACPASQQAVSSLVFKLSNLMAAVQRYNSCVRPQGATVASGAAARRRSQVSLGVLLGGEISQMVLKDDDTPVTGKLNGAVSPAVGLGLQCSLPLLSERLALRIEALYEQQRYDEVLANNSFYTYKTARVQASASYLRVPVLLRYTFPTGRVRPFLQVGACYAALLKHTQELQFIFTNTNGSPGYAPTRPISASVRNYELSPVLSLGVQMPDVASRALAIEARAERGGGILSTSSFDNYVARYFLLLSYSLTKTN